MKKTKKYICGLLMVVTALLTSCSDFTDLQPKGKNLLTTTDQLEMLLNAEYYHSFADERTIAGDLLYAYSNVSSQLSQPNKTRDVIMWTWDAANQDKMAELTSNDDMYNDYYGYIGRISNPILMQVEAAEGAEAKKKQLKCEALTLRAYCHFLLVNKFAKGYNPTTAATDPGIIYMTEDKDINVLQEKSTVQQVYDNILADVDKAIEIDGMPDKAVNTMRLSKPCAYSLKAITLITMQRWDEAEEAAKQALAIKNAVSDYTKMLDQTITGYITGGSYKALLRPKLTCDEDLFYIHNTEFSSGITPEGKSRLEKGNYIIEKIATMNMLYDYTEDAFEAEVGLAGYTMTYDLTSGWNSAGFSTPQMYLIVAEAELHKGNIDAAMEALDAIRVNRIDPDLYEPLKGKVTTVAEAMEHIKQTSAGEGLYGVWNFINRKRWNQVNGWQETLTKKLDDKTYTLAPDSHMWIFPFPQNAVNNNPNLKQNYKL